MIHSYKTMCYEISFMFLSWSLALAAAAQIRIFKIKLRPATNLKLLIFYNFKIEIFLIIHQTLKQNETFASNYLCNFKKLSPAQRFMLTELSGWISANLLCI